MVVTKFSCFRLIMFDLRSKAFLFVFLTRHKIIVKIIKKFVITFFQNKPEIDEGMEGQR
jgi:hypothetical protein